MNWSHDRDYFFKYATFAAAKAILTNCSLRWSQPSLFNDPFDVQFDLHVDFDKAIAKTKALDALWQAHYGENPTPVGNSLGLVIKSFRGIFPRLSRAEFDAEFGEAIDQGMQSVELRMPNFHKDIRDGMRDSKILCLSEVGDNILMWSHYSDCHRGVVLKLKCVPDEDSPWGVASVRTGPSADTVDRVDA